MRALASRSGQTANALRAVEGATSSSQLQLTHGRMTGSSETHQIEPVRDQMSSGSVVSGGEFLSPTDEQHYDISTPRRPPFLPRQLSMDSFTSDQQREMDELHTFLEQQDKRRINDIRNIARSGLVNLCKGNLVHELVTEQPIESASPADPSYLSPSVAAAPADPAFSSSAASRMTKPEFESYLSQKNIQDLQSLYKTIFGKTTDSFDKYYLKKRLLSQYNIQQSAFTERYLDQQATSAISISKNKPKNK